MYTAQTRAPTQSNRILSQIPLIVTPGKYSRPKPVTLPYDFPQLPVAFQANDGENSSLDNKLHDIADQYDQLIEQLTTENLDKPTSNSFLNPTLRSSLVKAYDDWESNTLKKLAPGYFDSNGGVSSVMVPTVRSAVATPTPTPTANVEVANVSISSNEGVTGKNEDEDEDEDESIVRDQLQNLKV
ncbi:hypothetical protein CANARDRAFT_28918 [[Candida] arabinofermentans NRRL YB-2248]|uniref:Uncharacterized protein n=1 Tax=[Candida] arabinofermentans NRRL YB-2248 TaxID=983967 RepID=A0A1E4SZ76_9ASCO|nr:hypothetical protein CANARDRAFT_28918 [[Candida] arabinofermentans NRRL YB-2248]